MKPAPLDLPTIWRGCDWGPVILKWKDPNGDPINVSGWRPRAESLNINLNARITNLAQGITQMSLDRAQTANLKLGVETWDWIWEQLSNGQFRYPPFLSGKVAIKEPQTSTLLQILPAPANDFFENAIHLNGASGSITGTTLGATRQAGEPPGDNSVWYIWTPPRDLETVFSIGSDWMNIEVYTGVLLSFLNLEAASSGDPSAVSFHASEGTIYRIRVFRKTRTAAFTLTWHSTIPLPP